MVWTFYLDNIEIEEPVGFADIALIIKRDPQWHGIFFEASTSDLQFYGEAADYLRNKHTTLGFQADVTFKAVVDCGGEDEVFSGKLDFRKYKEKCGTNCFVVVPVEQEGCTMTMRNRYDQKVDLSDNVAFDKQTILPNYDGLNFSMELAAQETKEGLEGYVGDAGQTINYSDNFSAAGFGFRPTYDRVILASILTTNLDSPTSEVGADPPTFLTPAAITPVLLFEDEIACFEGGFEFDFRLKGNYEIITDDHNITVIRTRLAKGVWPGTLTDIDVNVLPNTFTGSFDHSFVGTVTLAAGEGVYHLLEIGLINLVGTDPCTFIVHFDPETKAIITANKVCPPTNAVVSLIHETASRVTEAITDHCLTVKSDYYGRTDSEPYAAAEDGCGSLRVLSSGLRIRNAENPTHFLSLKEIFESLNAIDNIGMGIEGTELRIEQAEYFYQDVEIIRHPAIPSAEFTAQPEEAYSLIKIGYKKWEIENTNGLDEFNSNKEFRTSLKTISNTLDQTSGFVAGGYAIENTRQQSFADTGAADTKYDNDTFIICVVRAAYAYGNYIAEQGNIDSGSGMYSPATAYNWRIRPMYNLIRWWKSVAQSYVNLLNTSSKLFFAAGVGNLLASGALLDACNVANGLLPENHDLTVQDIAQAKDATPIWKPETMTYRYPMSLRDYNTIKANPKGYIYAGCSEFVKGFITNITYRIAKGDADITLKLKWDI